MKKKGGQYKEKKGKPYQVYWEPEFVEEVDKKTSTRSKFLADIVRTYFTFERFIKEDISNLFTKQEMGFIFDALNGLIINTDIPAHIALIGELEDAVIYEGKDKKWGVDLNAIKEKIRSMNKYQVVMLMRLVEYLWDAGKVSEFLENFEGIDKKDEQ